MIPLPINGNDITIQVVTYFLVIGVLEQESSVLELFGLGLGLAQGVKADACDDQDGGAAERQLGVESSAMMSTVGISATNSRYTAPTVLSLFIT